MTIAHYPNGKPINTRDPEWKSASVTVSGTDPTTDITGLSGFTTLFGRVNPAGKIKVEASAAAYIRLNSATADPITLGATTPYINEDCDVSKIFVATNGAGVTITINLS